MYVWMDGWMDVLSTQNSERGQLSSARPDFCMDELYSGAPSDDFGGELCSKWEKTLEELPEDVSVTSLLSPLFFYLKRNLLPVEESDPSLGHSAQS